MQTVGIDWITCTAKHGTNYTAILPVGFEVGGAIEPSGYYDNAKELYPSGRLDWNSKNPKQGIMMRWTGGDLRTIRASGLDDEHIIGSLCERKNVKFTRIDIAVDLTDTNANPDDIFRAFRKGKAVTRVKKCVQINGYDKETNRTGNTVNFGSRKSPIFVRAYDKALETIVKNKVAEQELLDTLRGLKYKRIEAEIKGDMAPKAAKIIGNSGVAVAARATLEKFINFPTVPWWVEMMENLPSAEKGLMQGESHHASNSQVWLHQQALPAILRAIRSNDWYVIDTIENELGGVDIVCTNPKQLRLFD